MSATTPAARGVAAYGAVQSDADASREAQIVLERLLAAKNAKQDAAHRAFAEPRVAEEKTESEPSWLHLIAGALAVLVTWAVFGWAVVTVIAALLGGAK